MKCLNEQTLHGYIDGELDTERCRQVAAHVKTCAMCAENLSLIEHQIAVIAGAFAYQESLDVPTERIRERLERSINESHATSSHTAKSASSLSAIWSQFVDANFFGMQRPKLAMASFVALLFAVASGVLFINLDKAPREFSAEINRQSPLPSLQNSDSEIESRASNVAETLALANVENNVNQIPRTTPKAVNFKREIAAKENLRSKRANANKQIVLPGEKSYLDAIASLSKTFDASGDASLRAAYRSSLDVVDEAIAATRRTAISDPNDTVAVNFLRDAYESKITLLNSLASQIDANQKGSMNR